MIHHFTCTLLSDVVLPKRAATEGQVDSLTYLPGAKFMGIVAKHYATFTLQERHDLFHNGSVRFSNAYPYVDGRQFYPAPFAYFTLKGNGVTDESLYIDHLIPDNVRKVYSEKGKPLKQVRAGYLDAAGEHFIKVKTDFQLKSAYNARMRKSQDSQMFGYFSIPRGAVFAFTVEDPDDKYGDILLENLDGEHGIGRSRTAQYGRVRIDKDKEPTARAEAVASEEMVIYAASDLCFYDTFGDPSLPTAADLKFPDAEIDWARSQVRCRDYQSWNTTRWNRNADRWVVEAGSSFVLKEGAGQPEKVKYWVGCHHSEGFGQVWVNPPFLQANLGDYQRKALQKIEPASAKTKPTGELTDSDQRLLALLNHRNAAYQTEDTVYARVAEFIRQHKHRFQAISNSQWGTLRNYARHADNGSVLNKLVFDKDFGLLHRGQTAQQWANVLEPLRREVLELDKPELERRPELQPVFLEKLASEMA